MACDDNTAAFTQLYEKHADYVYGIALSFLRSAADAEDVTSDVFMQVYESRMQFQDDGHARAWLTVAVRNRCKNHLKSWVRRKRADLQEAENLPADAAHPEVREAMDAVFALPEQYRLPLVMVAVQGFSSEEAAKILKLNESTLRTRLSRARQMIRSKLGRGEQ